MIVRLPLDPLLNFPLQPVPNDRPEDIERTRTPFGTSRQIGTAFYYVSSYVSSNHPSVHLSLISSLTPRH